MELIDVLDKNGKFTGKTKAREEIHRLGLWHRTVFVFVINNKKQILMQRRSVIKDRYPNMWDISIGGHIEAGSNSVESVIREAKEELGVDIKEKDLTYLLTTRNKGVGSGKYIDNEFSDVFLIKLDLDISKLKLQPKEVDEVKLIDIFELEKIIKRKDKDFVRRDGEYQGLFQYIKNNF